MMAYRGVPRSEWNGASCATTAMAIYYNSTAVMSVPVAARGLEFLLRQRNYFIVQYNMVLLLPAASCIILLLFVSFSGPWLS